MNEPKRRGRPPKASIEGADVPVVIERIEPSADAPLQQVFAAQAYANRVWSGQSPSLPYGERWYRVKVALEAQDMSMDGVVLK